MARENLGKKCRHCRREGMKLFLKGEKCLTDKCAVERRTYPPGEHGRGRAKQSEYRLQLREKQKARRLYGVLERQFRRHFAIAEGRPGVTGENLLQVLEMRLDNVVYRLGLADSRPQARQVLRHGHIEVNGHKLDIPSYQAKVGDEIRVREGSKANEYFQVMQPQLSRKQIAPWMELNTNTMVGRIMRLPDRDELGLDINEQLIVEFYSR